MDLVVAVPRVPGHPRHSYRNECDDADTNLEDALAFLGWLGMAKSRLGRCV